jgi:tetratricopeptide (TPR) repeat protein
VFLVFTFGEKQLKKNCKNSVIMKNISIILTTISLEIILFVSGAFSQEASHFLQDPLEYFTNRTKAISLARSGNWQQLIPIMESLTQQYQNDGDLFYLLGLAYYETGQYQKAITALNNTLDLSGTALNDIPTGSAPSNDIMIKIAKAYALEGDKSNSITWLQKGFESRYDEKPFLKGDPAFKTFNEDKDFLKLFGYCDEIDLTREKAWRCDIDYLAKRIIELHYRPYHHVSKANFEKLISELKLNIDSISDEQIIVELMKIIGSLGNGHNLIIPTSPKNGALKRLPIQFYQFDDGVFIVNAEEKFQQWIGYKVESIGAEPIEEALEKTNAVNARDNDMQTLWLGPYYLGLPDVLEGLGIIKNSDQVVMTLTDSNGVSQEVIMNPIEWSFAGFPKLPQLMTETQPLFLSKMNDPYWYKFLQDDNVIYIQFNAVTNNENQSLKDFNVELRDQIAQRRTQNLILDLRHNHGGDGSLLRPILKTLQSFEIMNPQGKVFVIIGRETFSAGHNLLTEITKSIDPILVGEPSGSKPNHIGEAGWYQLPYSGLMGLVSTQFHQDSKPEDNRKWIAPHIPVSLSSSDYFNGNDKAFNTIMEVIKVSDE